MNEGVSLFFRNLFFTILQPGMVTGLIPYLILDRSEFEVFHRKFLWNQFAGAFIFLTGLTILLICIIYFGVKGKGTLSPVDPTKKLVTSGLYRISRNPMYAGIILILAGEALFFQSTALWIYLLIIFTGLNLFIILHEEPRLRRDFGDEYKNYTDNVRRWFVLMILFNSLIT